MFTCFLLASGLLAADPDPKTELAKFQGSWVLVSGVVDGKPVDAEQVKKGRLTYEGDKATLVTPHQSAEQISAKVTLKPVGKGGEMDFVRDKGPGVGVTMQSRYEWDGADSYKIVFDPTGKERPKTLESKPGSGRILHVWKREK